MTCFVLTTAPVWTACHANPVLQPWCDCPRLELEDGEEHKTLAAVERIWRFLLDRRATRDALLVNVGGGMVCDLGGFAASTYKRGIAFVNVPTTLLAMVDASTGGKTGFDYAGLKNIIGTFALPARTLIEPSFLRTLPPRQLLSGYGEMLKHALLDTENHWNELLRIAEEPDKTAERMGAMVPRSLAVKERIVSADPQERGLRRALNLGHTVGHAIEAQTIAEGAAVPHGYCVVYGMVCALYISVLRYDFPRRVLHQLEQLMLRLYGRPVCNCRAQDTLLDRMRQDKKNTDSGIRFTLLHRIGDPVTDATVSESEIREAVAYLFSL